jgi:hypothetical protein
MHYILVVYIVYYFGKNSYITEEKVMIKLGIVMDPIDSIDINKDTSFAITKSTKKELSIILHGDR